MRKGVCSILINIDLLFAYKNKGKKGNIILAYFAVVNILLVVFSYPLIQSSYVMNE